MNHKSISLLRLVLLCLLGMLAISFMNMLGIPNPFYNPFSRPAAIPKPVTPVSGNLSADEQNIIEVYKRFSPSVVYITSANQARFSLNVFQIPRGTGSGFVWDHNGHIVTNYHVIRHADTVFVKLQDQSTWRAQMMGFDAENDIAVLRCGAPPDRLQPAIIGESAKLQVGQRVMAIGNPFGLDTSLTVGYISALGRQIITEDGLRIDGLIQTDAAINPGNSGGPLLDSFGRVVGVNTAIYSPSGANAGIGFSVPIDKVNEIVPHLISRGAVPHAFLGVTILPPHVEKPFGVEGMIVGGIVESSPAERAGLSGIKQDRRGILVLGDVITGVNGEPVSSGDELVRILRKYKPGDEVTLQVLRTGNSIELKTVLDVKPS